MTALPPQSPPIQPHNRSRGPLSYSQDSMWFLKQLDPDSNAYNMNFLFKFTGEIDPLSLEKAINEIVRRHEPFRTVYPSIGGQPVQVVQPFNQFTLPRVDFSTFPEYEREAAVKRYATEQGSLPYDLHQGPLVRFGYLHTSPNEAYLYLGTHHIGFDGWSLQIVLDEMIRLYDAFHSGGAAPLPEVKFPFSDYARWQKEWLSGRNLDVYIDHWKNILSGDLPILDLPSDHPRPAIQTYRGAKFLFSLSKVVSTRIRNFCQKERITPFHFFLAVYALLLSRYSNQEDLIIGCPFANRATPGIEKLVGMFINTLPIRIDLSGNPSSKALIEQVRSRMLDAFVWQEAPFERLVSEITTERDLSRTPVFQVVINMRNFPKHQAVSKGLAVELVTREDTPAQFDLSLDLEDSEDSYGVSFRYNTDLFEEKTIAHMAAHYQNLLSEVLSNTERPISELEMLTPSERERILYDWNVKSDYPREKTIHQLFEEIAAVLPNAPAVTFSGASLSYRELNAKANQLAHALLDNGIQLEERVGVYVERSPEMVVALLAILKAGGAYVPLDAANPPARLSFILKDTGAKILLTLERHLNDLPEYSGKVICIDDAAVTDKKSEDNPNIAVSRENLAYIIYTSGSTGQPKGSRIPHRAVVRLVKNTNYADFNADEVFLQLAPLAFDASTFEIWGSLLNGAQLVIFPPRLPTLQDLAGFIRSNGVSTLWLTAALFHEAMESHPEIVDTLHQMLSGGDVLSPRHVKIGLARNPHCRFINGYGPTENTTFTCCHTIKDIPEAGRSLPIGKPITNTSVYILDAHQKPVPVGVVGELFTGGDGLSKGYLNQPELTKSRFVPDPFSSEPGGRLFRTGDYARWLPDGNIEFIGRRDNQVKIRGYRVELEEVESSLKQHPGILDAAVIARIDPSGNKVLAAYYVPVSHEKIRETELSGFLQKTLPSYMIPTVFIAMETFPHTSSGKIDRNSLPGLEKIDSLKQYLAPRNETERKLVRIWEEVMGAKQIGINDNFFELGGHSLLAVRLFSRIQEEFGVSLPLTLLFQVGTVEAIASTLDERETDLHAQGITPLRTEGDGIPIFILSASLETRDLVRDFSPERPIYSLEPVENGAKVFKRSIRETAGIYYQNLVNFFPQGPYVLLGHSGYGWFTIELARLLMENEKKVAFLGLLDTYPPSAGSLVVNPIDQGKTRIKYLKGKTFLEILQYPRRYFLRFLKRHGIKLRVNEKALNRFVREERVKDLMEMVLREYEMQPFSGNLTLFWATERPRYLHGDPLEEWKKYLSGQLTVVPVVGDHSSILRTPNSRVLAQKIETLLPLNESA